MLLALHAVDWGLIGLFLLSVVVVGLYFARQQRTTTDFAVGGRSLPAVVAGCSLAVTLVAAHWYVGIPSQAYDVGLKLLLAPIGLCLSALLVAALVLPLLARLEILSIYEYLEMRFGPAVRTLAAGAWVLWQAAWLAVVLAIPCRVISVACGGLPPAWLWIVLLAAVAAVPACLGGMKAVGWTDLWQLVVMAAALTAVTVAVVWKLDGGPSALWQTAQEYGRDEVAQLPTRWDVASVFSSEATWMFLNALSFFFVLMLVFTVADQTVLQRLLATDSLRHCRRGFLVGIVVGALLLAGLTFTGIGLFSFYQELPNEVRPVWVVNLNNQTRQSLTVADRALPADELAGEAGSETEIEPGDGAGHGPLDAGAAAGPPLAPPVAVHPADLRQPLVNWTDDLRDPDTLARLVAERRILRPNNKLPFDDVKELLDPAAGRLDVERLAMRKPDGELVLHADAGPELLPHFVARKLGMGLLGLAVAGILAAVLASFDSGVHSLATVLLVDFHRRGVGRSWLAARLGKPAGQITESDELIVARPLTATVALLAMLLAFAVGETGQALWFLKSVTLIVGAPLLAVFALGILTRGATQAGACAGLVGGLLLTAYLVLGSAAAESGGPLGRFWPVEPLAESWLAIGGLLGTFLLGWIISLAVGQRRSKQQLRGLVVGVGELGNRELTYRAITIPGETPPSRTPIPGTPPSAPFPFPSPESPPPAPPPSPAPGPPTFPVASPRPTPPVPPPPPTPPPPPPPAASPSKVPPVVGPPKVEPAADDLPHPAPTPPKPAGPNDVRPPSTPTPSPNHEEKNEEPGEDEDPFSDDPRWR